MVTLVYPVFRRRLPAFFVHIDPFSPFPTTKPSNIHAHIWNIPQARILLSVNQSPQSGRRRTSPAFKTTYYHILPLFSSHAFQKLADLSKNTNFYDFQFQQTGWITFYFPALRFQTLIQPRRITVTMVSLWDICSAGSFSESPPVDTSFLLHKIHPYDSHNHYSDSLDPSFLFKLGLFK